MKLYPVLLLTVVSLAAVSCSDDNKNEPSVNPPGTTPVSKMYLLNEGSAQMNNSSISMISLEGMQTVTPDYFFATNGQKLGETAQCLLRKGENMYVAVTGSNYIAKLNSECRLEKMVSCNDPAVLQGGIRYLATDNSNVYATFYGGYITKYTSELDLPKSNGLQRLTDTNLEGIAYLDGKLYVASSWNQTTDPETQQTKFSYYNDLYVVDAESMKSEHTIKVAVNPNVVESYNGKIYTVSYGDYGAHPEQVCQEIDPNGYVVKTIGNAYRIACGNDKVYMMESHTDWSTYTTTNTFHWYDTKRGTYHDSSFLQNAPEELASEQIYMMAVNPDNGDIYVGITYYTRQNGDLYRFDKDGKFISKVDCGGQNPKMAVFF